MTGDAYSQVAADQLDTLESTADAALWNAVVDALELILGYPGEAQKRSGALTDNRGRVVFRMRIAGHPTYKVFWTRSATGEARIEAVFPHEKPRGTSEPRCYGAGCTGQPGGNVPNCAISQPFG